MGLLNRGTALEIQLAKLAELGLAVSPQSKLEDLFAFHDRAALEKKPYRLLVDVLGIDLEREPWTPLCDRLWMCDYERVEDHGAYADVLTRLERMTDGALEARAITDFVDVEGEVAWLEFETRGARVHWDFEVHDDWLDPVVFERYAAQLSALNAPLRVWRVDEDYGQSSLFASLLERDVRPFEKLTGLRLLRVE